MALLAVLFDLDGTLVDPKAAITRSIRFSLEKLGEKVPESDELTWCIGPPLVDSFARLLDTADSALLGRAVSYYRERFSVVGVLENDLYSDTVSALERLSAAGFRLYVATFKPLVFAEQILEHLGILRYFDRVYGSSLDRYDPDKNGMIARVLSEQNLPAAEAVMVGDRMHDIAAARANGVLSAGMTYGYGGVDELRAAGADLLFDSLQALVDYLAQRRRFSAGASPGSPRQ